MGDDERSDGCGLPDPGMIANSDGSGTGMRARDPWEMERPVRKAPPLDDHFGRVIYWGAPVDGFRFELGEVLRVETKLYHGQAYAHFHRDDRSGRLGHIGYSEGDCARVLRRDEIKRVKVIEVGGLSGFARLIQVSPTDPAAYAIPPDFNFNLPRHLLDGKADFSGTKINLTTKPNPDTSPE